MISSPTATRVRPNSRSRTVWPSFAVAGSAIDSPPSVRRKSEWPKGRPGWGRRATRPTTVSPGASRCFRQPCLVALPVLAAALTGLPPRELHDVRQVRRGRWLTEGRRRRSPPSAASRCGGAPGAGRSQHHLAVMAGVQRGTRMDQPGRAWACARGSGTGAWSTRSPLSVACAASSGVTAAGLRPAAIESGVVRKSATIGLARSSTRLRSREILFAVNIAVNDSAAS